MLFFCERNVMFIRFLPLLGLFFVAGEVFIRFQFAYKPVSQNMKDSKWCTEHQTAYTRKSKCSEGGPTLWRMMSCTCRGLDVVQHGSLGATSKRGCQLPYAAMAEEIHWHRGVRLLSTVTPPTPANFYGMPTRIMQMHCYFIIVVLLSWNCWRLAPLCCAGQRNGAHQQRQQPLHGTKEKYDLGLLAPNQAISVSYTKTCGLIRIIVFQIHITICRLL